MIPIRQIFPARGPSPAPISMLNSLSSVFLTSASFTPSGQRTAFIWQLILLLDQELEPHRFEPCLERVVMALVPRPTVLQPFLADEEQRLMQSEERIRRRGVVVGAGARAPVAEQEVHVHEPGVDLVLARF